MSRKSVSVPRFKAIDPPVQSSDAMESRPPGTNVPPLSSTGPVPKADESSVCSVPAVIFVPPP